MRNRKVLIVVFSILFVLSNVLLLSSFALGTSVQPSASAFCIYQVII